MHAGIRAPTLGVTLGKIEHGGESVSTQFDSPTVAMSDASTLRVRPDVDDEDVSKVRIRKGTYVTSDALGSKRFWGGVICVGRILGRKNIRTDEPPEYVDSKILGTLVELDVGKRLPLRLSVDAFVEAGKRNQARKGGQSQLQTKYGHPFVEGI